jgi:hypothetical protein
MARVDDYKHAVELAREELKGEDPMRIAEGIGAAFQADKKGGAVFSFPFMGKSISAAWPAVELTYQGRKDEIPIQQQVLLLHYLKGAVRARAAGEWIAYQEVPDGKFYLDAFLRRAKIPMVQAFGSQPERLLELAAQVYGAKPFDQGDLSVLVQALPKVPVVLILWKGDEEFPPEGNILFDKSISDILSAEDIAWLAGMIIYPLMGMANKKG